MIFHCDRTGGHAKSPDPVDPVYLNWVQLSTGSGDLAWPPPQLGPPPPPPRRRRRLLLLLLLLVLLLLLLLLLLLRVNWVQLGYKLGIAEL